MCTLFSISIFNAIVIDLMKRDQNGCCSPTYNSFRNMKQRVLNPKATGFKNYGGRGLTVDPIFLTFAGFVSILGERPKGKTLGRINNELGYVLGNVRWETPEQQASNKRPRQKKS